METTKNIGESNDELQKLTEAFPTAISLFSSLSKENRQKLFTSICTIFDLSLPPIGQRATASHLPSSTGEHKGHFSEDRSMPPKDFMLQKQPQTDVERVACLAYYLTHYRETPYFKTLDISKLNTDAAQMKFSNAAMAVDNAAKYGYLAPASKGNKQLSAAGELFVRALPDREAAKSAMNSARPRRRTKKSGTREVSEKENEADVNLTQ